MGNGWPISSVTGIDALRTAATKVFATGSYWFGAAPMAAAIATLETLRDTDAIGKMRSAGQLLRDGLDTQAASHGFSLCQTGPVQMPMVRFEDDPDRHKGNRFCTEAVRRGVFLHPWHNMFLSAAHTPDDIKQALERTDEAFAALARSV